MPVSVPSWEEFNALTVRMEDLESAPAPVDHSASLEDILDRLAALESAPDPEPEPDPEVPATPGTWRAESGTWATDGSVRSTSNTDNDQITTEVGGLTQTVTAVIAAGAAKPATYPSVIARWTGLWNFYGLQLEPSGAVRIFRWTSNTINSYSAAGVVKDGDTVRLAVAEETDGTRVTAYVNGVEKLTAIDRSTDRPMGLRVGFRVGAGAGATPSRWESVQVAATGGTTPPPPPPPPPLPPSEPLPPTSGAGPIAALKMPARGFFSGVSAPAGSGALGGDPFGTWRGSPTDMVATWHDQHEGASWSWGPIQAEVGFKGLLDIAPGGPSNFSSNALDASWRDYLGRLKAARTIGGVLYPTILRPCHELNGDWYPWSVGPGEEAAFVSRMTAWRRIQLEVWPEAIFALSFNGDTTTMMDPNKCVAPGLWDLIGSDQYNIWPFVGRTNGGKFTDWTAAANTWKRPGVPRGVETWRQWAESKGLPLYFPEYANGGSDGGDPYWMERWYPYVKANAGKGPGKILAEAWFNIEPGQYGDSYWLLNNGQVNPKQPEVARVYRDAHPIS